MNEYMTTDDIKIIEKLDKATAEIFGCHVPLMTLIRFYRAVMYPETKVELAQKRDLVFLRKQAD